MRSKTIPLLPLRDARSAWAFQSPCPNARLMQTPTLHCSPALMTGILPSALPLRVHALDILTPSHEGSSGISWLLDLRI